MQPGNSPIVSYACCLLPAQAALGEGALWNSQEGLLYWVDILGKALHIYNPDTGEDRQLPVSSFISTVVPVQGSKDVLVALQSGIYRMNTGTATLTLIASSTISSTMRFNDGKCDPSGRLWAGTMSMDGTREAAILYRLDGNGSLHEMLQGVSISNGIVWTSDRKTMYHNDTPTRTVQAFDYDDATGSISNRRIAFTIPEGKGFPDGMSIDSEDRLWIALWGAGCVGCFDPHSGSLLKEIKVPAPHTSSCAFGGTDLKTLFITTARAELSADELEKFPQSGDLFSIEVDIAGIAANSYRLS